MGIISLASSLSGLGRRAADGEEGGGPDPFPNPPAGGSLSLQPAHPRPAHRGAPARYARGAVTSAAAAGVRPPAAPHPSARAREPCLPSRTSGPRWGEGAAVGEAGERAASTCAAAAASRAATLPRELSSGHWRSARVRSELARVGKSERSS